MGRGTGPGGADGPDLDSFYARPDPWGYFSNPEDLSRKRIFMHEMGRHAFGRVLDIGCGNGFLTETIDAEEVVGVDISQSAIAEAQARSARPGIRYLRGSLFDIPHLGLGDFDGVIVTGVLYPQYIGTAHPLVYLLVDQVLRRGGALISIHIDEWYSARFPYPRVRSLRYGYREYRHVLEVYRK